MSKVERNVVVAGAPRALLELMSCNQLGQGKIVGEAIVALTQVGN